MNVKRSFLRVESGFNVLYDLVKQSKYNKQLFPKAPVRVFKFLPGAGP